MLVLTCVLRKFIKATILTEVQILTMIMSGKYEGKPHPKSLESTECI